MNKPFALIGYGVFALLAIHFKSREIARSEAMDSIASLSIYPLLGIVVSVTLAAILHLQMELSKFVAAQFKDVSKGVHAVSKLRRELKENALLLVLCLFSQLACILIGEQKPHQADAAVNVWALGNIILAFLLMYDVHKATYGLITSDVYIKSLQKRSK